MGTQRSSDTNNSFNSCGQAERFIFRASRSATKPGGDIQPCPLPSSHVRVQRRERETWQMSTLSASLLLFSFFCFFLFIFSTGVLLFFSHCLNFPFILPSQPLLLEFILFSLLSGSLLRSSSLFFFLCVRKISFSFNSGVFLD